MSNLHHHSYVAGEDANRLQSAAESMGLDTARSPMVNVRVAMAAMFLDSTLESARMHSVGALGQDEHVDNTGTLHVRTLTRRKRGKRVQEEKPKYGTLQDLFHKEPLPADDEEVVEEVVDMVEGGSLTAAAFGIVKGTVGPAILYLPRGFATAGWAMAIGSMILATSSYLYSAMRLLQCWKVEKAKMEKLDEIRAFLQPEAGKSDGYGAIPSSDKQSVPMQGATLLTYPELARRAFGASAVFVQVGIAAMQFGVCLTYFIFVPQNLVESVRSLFGWEVDRSVFLLLMLAIEVPLSWIRDIRRLTVTNIVATFLIAYGLISCVTIALMAVYRDPDSNLMQRVEDLKPANDTWYLFVGTSFFVFEGSITLMVPLQEAVFRKEDKDKFPIVNFRVTSWIVVMYICFALICWASFGDSIKTALTASLPPGAFSTSVQFAYSLAVILTFPLQAFPALEVVFHGTDYSSHTETRRRNIMASLMTGMLCFVAYVSIDYLGNVVSLLGSLVGIPIALIFPPLMHNRLAKDSSDRTKWMNGFVALVGTLAMCGASFLTVISWDKGAE